MKPEPRLPISVCMISAAEAHRIGRAIESVRAWAREVIVVMNDEVADGTDRIAESMGARVIREPWKGMIAQKNSAAAKATGEWILDLDADEAVSEPLHAELQRMFANPGILADVAALSYPRLSWYCGRWIKHGDWYPDRQLRLWRRGRGKWGGVDPHAKLIVGGRVRALKGDLLHYSNESINRQVYKIITFSDEFLKQQQARGMGSGFLDLAFRPIWRFTRAYILRLGFLDGWPGYYIAWLNAFSAVTRYSKLRESAVAARIPETVPKK